MADCGQFRTLEIYVNSVVNTTKAERYFLEEKLEDLEGRILLFESCLEKRDLEGAGSLVITEEQRKYILKKMLPAVGELLGEKGHSKLMFLSARYKAAIELMGKMVRKEIGKLPVRDRVNGWVQKKQL